MFIVEIAVLLVLLLAAVVALGLFSTWVLGKLMKVALDGEQIFHYTVLSSVVSVLLAVGGMFLLVLQAKAITPLDQKFECCGLFDGGLALLVLTAVIYLVVHSIVGTICLWRLKTRLEADKCGKNQ